MSKFQPETQQQLVYYFSHILICIAGEEYTPVSTDVTLNASTSTHTMNIPILDNEIVAGSTMFSVFLTSADPAAVLNPASADITIEDDDSEKPWILCIMACKLHFSSLPYLVITIGFSLTTYNAAESAGSVNVTVNILNGTLARDVHVLLITSLTDSTATGIEFLKNSLLQIICLCNFNELILIHLAMVDYTVTSSDLTFDAAPSSQTVTIPTLDDTIVEGSETIIVTLASTDPAAILNPRSASVTIEDNDGK